MQRAISNYTISIAIEIVSMPENTVVKPGAGRCLRRGLSRVCRKTHARFLGGRARATASGYPTTPGANPVYVDCWSVIRVGVPGRCLKP